ncbi:apical junction molecule [Drosophila ficusphila]|uniref:apical junction molecule n=1 Tax=Drosophila ficusphila TaxID=30025 RepID=UPI001C890B64|nr:apical junction molecule [Drosophila ficusphila]
MDAQFEHLCRICAANTKSKTNSVTESVFIFKTQGLKDKISRHLYLNVAEDDPLPKVLCKSCYRQVEATASLSNIAKHTQLVFRDFLLSTLPKNDREAAAARLNVPPASQISAQSEGNQRQPDEFRPIMLTRAPETTTTLSRPQEGQKAREVNLESCRGSPLSASLPSSGTGNVPKTGKNIVPARRNSVFMDSFCGSAPMSIAQRSMQHLPSLVPLNFEPSASSAPKKNPDTKLGPGGVINFIQTHGRITGNVPVSGKERKANINSRKDIRNTASMPLTLTASNAGMPNLPKNLFQQKSRNLKNTLNNIKAMRSGQVSLLKSAQVQKPADGIRPLVTTTLVPQYGGEPSVEEALPEHMIFAAPKKKREDELSPQTDPPKLKKYAPSKSKVMSATLDLLSTVDPPASSASKSAPNVRNLTDAISLGSVIRDPDLLMLILKALKWSVTTENCEEQMTRLKSSKFAVIMSDNNLLQDTDLTQLLGPYLAPMLSVVQQQDQLPVSSAIASTNMTTSVQVTQDVLNLSDLSSTMPYKLPPETSVQLVPSSPTEQEMPPLRHTKAIGVSVKRPTRMMRSHDLPIGDKSGTITTVSASNAVHISNELSNINAKLISQFGSNPADALNEALISLLNQHQKVPKDQRHTSRRRSGSLVNLEDIVLVEPQPPLEAEPSAEEYSESVSFFPQARSTPADVTRPIVKRRKTVIQSSKPSTVVDSNPEKPQTLKNTKDQCSSKESAVPRQLKKIEIEDESTVKVKPAGEPSQAPTSTVLENANESNVMSTSAEDHSVIIESGAENEASEDTENSKAGAVSRKSEVKAVLGQKLLEAIGLPQLGKDIAPESSRDTLRSALKRSIKQAQEQQKQLKRGKQEEPVKQLADSTTKINSAESADEHKKAIAERELALLNRGQNSGEESKVSVKEETSERTDVSSSSSRNRRSRKSKTDATAEDSGDEEKKNIRWDEDDDLPLKTDAEKAAGRNGNSSNRPTRTSKTLSKYYKGPSAKSQHAMGTRSTRQR